MTTVASAHEALSHVPAPAAGVELLGEPQGSGYKQPPSLVRRGDGQTIALTPLLYAVLAAIDGKRDVSAIAAAASESSGRQLRPEDVGTLVEAKLRPLGLLRGADGGEPAVRKADPLLALRFKYVVTDPDVTGRVTAPFAWLFSPVVVAVVVAAFAAVAGWVVFDKGLASATHDAFERPSLLLLVLAVTALSAGFHEFGHAAACRRGGAAPGAMGAGLYLCWPAFYTDVTDSYRLPKWSRLRVDVGGLYFNMIFALGMFGVWAATRSDALLLIIGTQLVQMLRQLSPMVRFDGYHILSDLTGVPDLYSHIKPTLLSVLPTSWGRSAEQPLKLWARIVVVIWVLVVVPLLLLSAVLMVVLLPRLIGTAWASLHRQLDEIGRHWAQGDLLAVGASTVSLLALGLSLLGMGYLLVRLVRQVSAGVWRTTAGHPRRRAGAVLVAAALVALLAVTWWPEGERYRPIERSERGTLTDVVTLRAASAPVGLRDGQVVRGRRTAVWVGRPPVRAGGPGATAAGPSAKPGAAPSAGPGAVPSAVPSAAAEPSASAPSAQPAASAGPASSPAAAVVAGSAAPAASADPAAAPIALPSRDAPQLSLVLVPRDSSEPAWVFPFDKPAPPAEGGNQALSINTADGTTVYDVAFALVWADGNTVLNRNEAHAYASCTNCTTVAIGFQVVLVLGDANVVAPQNLAGALNYRCAQCVTYALAKQLVVQLPNGLSAESTAKIEKLWEQIDVFGTTADGLSPEAIRAELLKYEAAMLDIVEAEATAVTPAQQSASPEPSAAAPEPSVAAPSSSATPSGAAPPGSATPSAAAPPSAGPSSSTAPSEASPGEAQPTGEVAVAPTSQPAPAETAQSASPAVVAPASSASPDAGEPTASPSVAASASATPAATPPAAAEPTG